MAFVLILDPDAARAERMMDWLRQRGHEVRECGRPHQALRRIRLHRFNMVWMAWPLAGIEPLEIMRRLRQIRPLLPVAVIEREAMPIELRQKLKARGVRMILRGDPARHVAEVVTEVICAV